MSFVFNYLDPPVACGDGTHAGIYESSPPVPSNDLLIVINGGGFCEDEETCQEAKDTRPYRLGSGMFPSHLKGDTILSDDPNINPTMHSYHKWMVPMCTHDLFLGAGLAEFQGLRQTGSLHLLGVIEHILSNVQQIDRLVVVGISAGSIGLINHLAQIRDMAQKLQAKRLKIITDSVMFGDSAVRDLELFSSKYIDFSVHPLCDIKKVPLDPQVSTIPCCISIHCQIRNGLFNTADALAGESNDSVPEESVLMIDATYDILSVSDLLSNGYLGEDTFEVSRSSDVLFETGEFGGARNHAVRDSLLVFSPPEQQVPIIWATSSCLTHQFLLVSLEFEEKLQCNNNLLEGTDEYRLCTEEALGYGEKTDNGLKVGAWLSINTWEMATAGNHSIKNLVEGFVDAETVPFNPPLLTSPTTTPPMILFDDCNGPNCVPYQSEEMSTCQDLFFIENEFVDVPVGFQVALAVFTGFFIMAFFFRFGYAEQVKEEAQESAHPRPTLRNSVRRRISTLHRSVAVQQTVGIKIEELSATTKDGQKLLSDVNFELKPGTVNGLMGRSGSGKSTLLGAISGQLHQGVALTTDSDVEVNIDSTTYLRQFDNVSLENLTPLSYLEACADVYGADASNLRQICSFVKPFFPRRAASGSKDLNDATEEQQDEEEELLVEPFERTQIKSCSGGQRRVLAVGAALLTNPTVLLLDEPLSGLDSVASERLMDLLSCVAVAQDLTVLVTVHQPSDAILEFLHDVLILKEGQLAFREDVPNITRALRLAGEGQRISDFVHEVVKVGKMEPKMTNALQRSHAELDRKSIVFSRSVRRRQSVVRGEAKTKRHALAQVLALSRRHRLEYGNIWHDLFILPTCYTIVSLILSLRHLSPFQVTLANSFFIFTPYMACYDHILLSKEMWAAHRRELDDRRISCASYYLATFLFTMSLPLFATLVALTIGYLVLGWPAESFLVTYLITVFHLLAQMQLGRALMVVFRGERIFFMLNLLVAFYNVLFSGLLASPNDSPNGLLWLFMLSFSYWALSGAVLYQFQFFGNLGQDPCTSFLACALFDEDAVVEASGLGKLTTPFRSLGVLVGFFFLCALAEYLLLRNRRTHFVNPKRAKKST